MGESGDLRVLLGDALAGVKHYHADIGPFYGSLGAHDAVFFDFIVNLGAAAYPCGVDEDVFSVVVFKVRVHRVARRSGDVADDNPRFAEDGVSQRGLSYVRAADNRNLYNIVLFRLLGFGRKVGEAGVEQVAVPCPCMAETLKGSPRPSE
jgi:hypothetical protein